MKVGDVVMLKSGGPHMTVAAVHPGGGTVAEAVTCLYFRGAPYAMADKMAMLYEPQRYRETFPVDALIVPGGSRIVTPA